MWLKKLLIIIIIFSFSQAFAQNSYEYDYVLSYSQKINGMVKNEYKFFNSKDNSSMFTVTEHGKKLALVLRNADGKFFRDSIAGNDFFVEAISLKCPLKGVLKNTSKESLDDYEILLKNDTLIGNENLSHFILNPKNARAAKNMPSVHYIMDNKLGLKIPVLEPFGFVYGFWKKGINIPNGIIKECYRITNGQKETLIELVQYAPIKKIIMIDNNCR